MLKVNRDNTLEIYRGDAFSLLCSIDRELNENEKLTMYVVDDEKNIVVEKHAKKYENGLYFVFGTIDTNLKPAVYNYYIKMNIDELNGTTIVNSLLTVKESV